MTPLEVSKVIKEFEQGRKGYVLKFNKRGLAEFIYDSIEVDITDDSYEQLSMSKMLRQVFIKESRELTDKLTTDLQKLLWILIKPPLFK